MNNKLREEANSLKKEVDVLAEEIDALKPEANRYVVAEHLVTFISRHLLG